MTSPCCHHKFEANPYPCWLAEDGDDVSPIVGGVTVARIHRGRLEVCPSAYPETGLEAADARMFPVVGYFIVVGRVPTDTACEG
jgi:hypothetical protein